VASYLSPKILITYIDNSLNYKYIKLLNSNIRVISIQNGIRYDFMMQKYAGFEFDVYLGFGQVEKEIMEKAEIIVYKYYPVGALSLCNKNIYNSVGENKYDIVFISDIISADFHSKYASKKYKIFYALYEEYTKIICNYLDTISKETGLSIAVAMRTNQIDPAHDIESSLYRPFSNLISIPRIQESSYQLCINSTLVITIGSTLGYEMLGLKKKVLFCNGITEISSASFNPPFITNYYIDYLQDSYLIKILDLKTFKEKILTMIQRPKHLHLADIEIIRNKYMNFSDPEGYKSDFNEIVMRLIS
jgi:surface carbohydrate biosynthesis protein